MTEFLFLMTLLIAKHFVADALLQNAYQYLNKGKFLHPGGLLHAYIHSVLTVLCFWGYNPTILLLVGVLDFVIHYFVDYSKMNLSRIFEWSAYDKDENGKPYLRIYSNNFFIILILDQCLHMLTYVLLIYLALGVS